MKANNSNNFMVILQNTWAIANRQRVTKSVIATLNLINRKELCFTNKTSQLFKIFWPVISAENGTIWINKLYFYPLISDTTPFALPFLSLFKHDYICPITTKLGKIESCLKSISDT